MKKRFNESRVYQGLRMPVENDEEGFILEEKQKILDRVILADSSDLKMYVSDGVASLIVTSPPYDAGKEYEKELTIQEYLDYLEPVWKECYRVLRIGGRMAVNIAGLGRGPYIQLQAYVAIQLERLHFIPRGWVIWNKSESAGRPTSWGSWLSPSNPQFRDFHEFILFYSKESEKLKKGSIETDISKEFFLRATKSIWDIKTTPGVSNHDAPFPLELPANCIRLLTWPGDLVIDPFSGSGTTCLAAKMLGRRWLGFEKNEKYVKESVKRIESYRPSKEL